MCKGREGVGYLQEACVRNEDGVQYMSPACLLVNQMQIPFPNGNRKYEQMQPEQNICGL